MVCGALKCSKVISVTNAPKLHVISSETRLSSELFGTIDLVQCDECGHIFNCSPSDGEIESSHDLFLTNTPISETMISRHEQTVDFLTSGVERKIRVLDVGAGSGALAAAFAKRGHEVTVVEPSSKIDGQALTRFGVNVNYVYKNLALQPLENWTQEVQTGNYRFVLVYKIRPSKKFASSFSKYNPARIFRK